MAGHSKWKNIQHRKGRQDAQRGKLFNKLAREIYVAACAGDKDPANNHQLRLAIAKAKAQNLPNENIERAIQKAMGGGEDERYEHLFYEGYGPEGVAILVEVLTDNRNRTAADVRHIFSKRGGNLGEAGCVAWMFERKGWLTIDRRDCSVEEEELLLLAVESGVEDYETTIEGFELITSPEQFEIIKENMEEKGIKFSDAEITFLPSNRAPIREESLSSLYSLLEALSEHDDVQNVYANYV
ncbi:DNA-binding regulatory protein, YebC/PmpR family [Seinonella peptonophila]|uniref:Probable transcriptional regulatory protein SAMN05444392_101610 n=1 Tax=Seinonella peptonophila TaxID=112248 RepID=A0A1M4TS41_9BACL|nr:YebC/PmpR family DNA-binding transcriptional regulator [Seinonella peptonophila]SHE47238.1 DNA-binding regulatory protein, YebC/PmpR family [Seinonella peptonophila]